MHNFCVAQFLTACFSLQLHQESSTAAPAGSLTTILDPTCNSLQPFHHMSGLPQARKMMQADGEAPRMSVLPSSMCVPCRFRGWNHMSIEVVPCLNEQLSNTDSCPAGFGIDLAHVQMAPSMHHVLSHTCLHLQLELGFSRQCWAVDLSQMADGRLSACSMSSHIPAGSRLQPQVVLVRSCVLAECAGLTWS